MALPLAAAAIGLIPSLYKTISGISQANRAKKINPIDPGYTMNQGILDNATTLSRRAGNYTMPGYGTAVNNIGSSAATAFNRGVEGASSGGDVLDLAAKIAYGQQSQLNDLAVQNAAGADQALLQSLDANAAAGQQFQNKNAYERQRYQEQLREKAALTQSGNENIYGGLDAAATVGTTLLNPLGGGTNNSSFGQTLNPQQLKDYQIWKSMQGIKQQNLGNTAGYIS